MPIIFLMVSTSETRQELHEGGYEICSQQIEQFVKQLADAVWRLDDLRTLAGECGIAFELLIPRIEEIKRILSDEMDVLPMEVCFLPYKDEIEQEQYNRIRTRLCEALEERPYLIKYIDRAYFDDRVLAEAVLKYGWPLECLTQYQDDEEIAAELYRLHGADSESWNHMSRRLRKQYQVKEK